MDLQTIRIKGTDKTRHDADVCNVIMTYELVEFTAREVMAGAESYAVLHRVQIEPTVDSTLLLDVPLHDKEALEHFEQLLSANLHGYPVGYMTAPQTVDKELHEVTA